MVNVGLLGSTAFRRACWPAFKDGRIPEDFAAEGSFRDLLAIATERSRGGGGVQPGEAPATSRMCFETCGASRSAMSLVSMKAGA